MRLGELLSTRHCDWHAGRGGTPFIEVDPAAGPSGRGAVQEQPLPADLHQRRAGAPAQRVRLAAVRRWRPPAVDLASHFVFVNLRRGQWLAPLRPETVYDKVASLKRRLGGRGPGGLDAALVSSHACLGLAAVRCPRACRDAQARARRHPDDFEPLRLGERGRRTAGAGRLAQLLLRLARLGRQAPVSKPPRHLHAAGRAGGPAGRAARRWSPAFRPCSPGRSFDPADPVLAGDLRRGSPAVLRTGALPVPMQREISWWLATCHDSGERVIDTTDWKRWVATAAEVTADAARGVLVRRPDPGGVDGRLGAQVPRATTAGSPHRTPGARAESALRGLLPRLAVCYSDAPWWKHDLWCLRFDPRIPRRDA